MYTPTASAAALFLIFFHPERLRQRRKGASADFSKYVRTQNCLILPLIEQSRPQVNALIRELRRYSPRLQITYWFGNFQESRAFPTGKAATYC